MLTSHRPPVPDRLVARGAVTGLLTGGFLGPIVWLCLAGGFAPDRLGAVALTPFAALVGAIVGVAVGAACGRCMQDALSDDPARPRRAPGARNAGVAALGVVWLPLVFTPDSWRGWCVWGATTVVAAVLGAVLTSVIAGPVMSGRRH